MLRTALRVNVLMCSAALRWKENAAPQIIAARTGNTVLFIFFMLIGGIITQSYILNKRSDKNFPAPKMIFPKNPRVFSKKVFDFIKPFRNVMRL